ncbi:molybdenum cofactor biosynthesis protein MoaE [Roseimaritima sediminicola]|uniref:molybdenum cofactor biosynthesis protein MoaE n=1 Tax=Roseimaritima sediminicola TaxID=2662066 RepID=UPI00129834E8|nr:molybdenum cofactor biosynthesis protein MoaE [Roseimaritima sediminicola]
MAAELTVRLVDHAIELQALWQRIADPDCGAQLVFVGATRQRTATERDVLVTRQLAYQAYRPMAEKELRVLLEEAAERWPLRHLVAVHRLGEVPVGQASVAIGLSSPHRGACMEAMPWIMDELKRRVPVWKQEHYDDGSTQWIHR